MTYVERFLSKCIPEPNSGCWLWTAGMAPKDYGLFCSGKKHVLASRESWRIHRGSIPDGMCVLHKCDTPPCVNPDHLWLGTVQDNSDDMVRKGRSAKGDRSTARLYPERCPRGDNNGMRLHPESVLRGEDNGWAKLSNTDALAIRRMHLEGYTYTYIASRFGVNRSTVTKIAQGQSWKHVRPMHYEGGQP